MNFIHSKEVIKDYPSNYTGLIVIKKFSNYKKLSNSLEYYRNDIISDDFLNDVKPISQKWQHIFLSMGADSDAESSLTYLINYFEKKKKLFRLSPIVDFYNYYSLTKGIPMAAYDADKIEGNLYLGLLGKGRDFRPLNKPDDVEQTDEKELGYYDDNKVVCRYWNRQDCDETKITDSVQNILFLFDLLYENPSQAVLQFANIANDFKKSFYNYGEELDFFGITGYGLPNQLEFHL